MSTKHRLIHNEVLKVTHFATKLNIALIGLTVFYLISFWNYSQLDLSKVIVAAITILFIFNRKRHQNWGTLFLPLLLTTIIYDVQRLFAEYLRGFIHVKEPYQFDLRFFGIIFQNKLITPNEWWQFHLDSRLDLFCGFAYLFFIPEFFLLGSYFLFSKKIKQEKIAKQMLWGFFWLNLIGYSTYYWYPAAPPWYPALHGFGPADLAVQANLAGCVRFDEAIGIPIFKTWYGHSADVFGAIPSLHVAYPFLGAIYAFRIKKFRFFTLFFFLWVSFAAIYLNHHYVLDVLCGALYASIVSIGMTFWGRISENEN